MAATTLPYRELDTGQLEIRLLKLHEGQWGSKIRCDLIHVFLKDKPDYEALSYTWGEDKNPRSIFIAGQDWRVRPNLDIALRHLRFTDRPRTLWVDALCIDQGNVPERNAQVQIMRDVYQHARVVLSWLGEAGRDGEEAMELMEDFGTLLFDTWNSKKMPLSGMNFTWMEANGFSVTKRNWAALWTLWNRDYWSRVWVIQELACSIVPGPMIFDPSHARDRCLIGCGNKWISSKLYTAIGLYFGSSETMIELMFNDVKWERTDAISGSTRLPSAVFSTFSNIPKRVSQSLSRSRRKEGFHHMSSGLARTTRGKGVPPALRMYRTLARTSAEFGSARANALAKLLSVTANFDATDPRDKVYGLLGLSLERSCITPDYIETNTIQSVVKNLVKNLITNTQSLDILLGNRMREGLQGPTWTPELSGFDARSAAWFHGNVFISGGDSARIDVEFDTPRDLLRIRGIKVGDIQTVMGPYPASLMDRRFPASLKAMPADELARLNTIQRAFGYMDDLLKYGKELDPLEREACWRTLLLDVHHQGLDQLEVPAPYELGKLFDVMVGAKPIPPGLESIEQGPSLLGYLRPFYQEMEENLAERCFIVTQSRSMGIGPYQSREGDIVVVFLGGSLCFVLRPCGSNYELIGDAYLYGHMSGQVISDFDDGLGQDCVFSLC